MAYSIDYQNRAIAYKDEGHSFKELYEVFRIPSATYYCWKGKLNKGILGVKVKQTRRRKIDPVELRLAVEEKPDAYLRELAERFNCSVPAVYKRLVKMKMTYKKRHSPTRRSHKN